MMSRLFDLTSKKAVVAGATGGIGFACAQALLDHGSTLLLLGRDLKKLQETRKKMISENSQVEIVEVDLSDISQLRDFFNDHDLSGYEIWVNSIGVNRPTDFLEFPESDYDLIMEVNVKSAFFQTQYFVKGLQDRPGSIIHISSQMGHVGGFKRAAYCASKHALEGFCRAAAWELGQKGIRINTVSPTFIETDMTRKTMDDPESMKLINESIALGRIGKVEDVAGAVVYLASDASQMVTGTSIMVDGGWTAR